jgi:hypothetical protein
MGHSIGKGASALAFDLFNGVPEPATGVLAAMDLVALRRRGRGRRGAAE